jgi:hypothetical protein
MDTSAGSIEAVTTQLASIIATDSALTSFSDTDALTHAAEIEGLGRLVDGLRTAAAADLADRSRTELGTGSLATQQGQRTAAGLIAFVTRISEAEAKRRITLGRSTSAHLTISGETRPADFGLVAAALTSGSIGIDSARVITAFLRPALLTPEPSNLLAAEEYLVTAAKTEAADLVKVQAIAWREALDPDGTKPREDDLRAARAFTIGKTKDNGLTSIWGETDPLNAALLKAALDTYTSPRRTPQFLPDDDPSPLLAGAQQQLDLFDGTCGTGGTSGTDGTDLPGYRVVTDTTDPRTMAQKRHDVLLGLITAGLEAVESALPKSSRTNIVATIDIRDLESGHGAAFLGGSDEPVSALTIQEKLCDAGYQRLILGADGQVLNLGREIRLFQPAQRLAIGIRDGGCVFPGCTAPPAWCEVHHVTEYSLGGPTDTANGALLCSFHHHVIHNSDWELRMRHGKPEVLAPPWVNPARVWASAGLNRVGLVAHLRR